MRASASHATISFALLACGQRDVSESRPSESRPSGSSPFEIRLSDARPIDAGFAVYNTWPTLGPVGQWVYVFGYFFTNDARVDVGGVAATRVAFYDIDELGFAIPAGASGTVPVTITIGTTHVTCPTKLTIGVPHQRPTITSFDPRAGGASAWVTIDGDGFVFGDTLVVLGDRVVQPTVYAPEQLGFSIPDGVKGDIQLVVRTPNGDAHAEGWFHVQSDRRAEPVR